MHVSYNVSTKEIQILLSSEEELYNKSKTILKELGQPERLRAFTSIKIDASNVEYISSIILGFIFSIYKLTWAYVEEYSIIVSSEKDIKILSLVGIDKYAKISAKTKTQN